MELLIAILFALRVLIDPGMTQDEIKNKYPDDYIKAETIITNQTYHYDATTGIVIIDDGVNDKQ